MIDVISNLDYDVKKNADRAPDKAVVLAMMKRAWEADHTGEDGCFLASAQGLHEGYLLIEKQARFLRKYASETA